MHSCWPCRPLAACCCACATCRAPSAPSPPSRPTASAGWSVCAAPWCAAQHPSRWSHPWSLCAASAARHSACHFPTAATHRLRAAQSTAAAHEPSCLCGPAPHASTGSGWRCRWVGAGLPAWHVLPPAATRWLHSALCRSSCCTCWRCSPNARVRHFLCPPEQGLPKDERAAVGRVPVPIGVELAEDLVRVVAWLCCCCRWCGSAAPGAAAKAVAPAGPARLHCAAPCSASFSGQLILHCLHLQVGACAPGDVATVVGIVKVQNGEAGGGERCSSVGAAAWGGCGHSRQCVMASMACRRALLFAMLPLNDCGRLPNTCRQEGRWQAKGPVPVPALHPGWTNTRVICD